MQAVREARIPINAWLPLQLNDIIQVQNDTKSIKKKEKKTRLVYKLTRVHVQKKISY